MATRQYIGARYVPIFDGDWDITKDYEPLVIVSYQGNSYTSRTFVPHGTAITNETYWALTGNYNAQVEAYRQEVEDYKQAVDESINLTENKTFIGCDKLPVDIIKNVPNIWDILCGDDYKATYQSLQGGDYNSSNDTFVIAISDLSENMTILVTLDADFNVVSRHTPQALGHANDITYNARLNKFFVATGDSSVNAFNILCLDGDTLNIDYEHSGQVYGTNVPKWYISYDFDNDVYYIGDNTKIHKYTYDYANKVWTQVSEYTYTIPVKGSNVRVVKQSSFCFQSQFVLMCFIETDNSVISPTTYNNFALMNFDENGNIISQGCYPLSYPTDEPECVCVKNGVGYIFSESTWLIIREMYLDRASLTPIIFNKNDYESAISLKPASSDIVDLNDIFIAGKYTIENNTYAGRIANMPRVSAGNLYVETVSGNKKLQRFITLSSSVEFRRHYENSWSDWVSYDMRPYNAGRTLVSGTIDVNDVINNLADYNFYACYLNNSYGQSVMFGMRSGNSIRLIGTVPTTDGCKSAWIQINYNVDTHAITSIVDDQVPSNYTSITYLVGII